VLSALAEIDGNIAGETGIGFLVLLGIKDEDTKMEAVKLAEKICNLRIFNDADEKMNLSINSVSGDILVVFQFARYADCKSRRLGSSKAARPEVAIPLYELFVNECKNHSGRTVKAGFFGSHMHVESVNDDPVTIILIQQTSDNIYQLN